VGQGRWIDGSIHGHFIGVGSALHRKTRRSLCRWMSLIAKFGGLLLLVQMILRTLRYTDRHRVAFPRVGAVTMVLSCSPASAFSHRLGGKSLRSVSNFDS
jgi:hypothetical protein